MELSNQPPGSHPLTAPVHPPERVTGPPELHHSKGRCPIDKLTGGTGSDTFVLGNGDGVFYNDGNSGSAGTSDYGWITDFKSTTTEKDKIQLFGQASDYVLASTAIGSTKGMGIYLNNGTGIGSSITGWDRQDELIGFIQGYTNTLLNSDFTFVTAPPPG